MTVNSSRPAVRRSVVRPLAPAALLACVATLGGCHSNQYAGNEASIRADPTPALTTLHSRTQDQVNRLTIMRDTNLRMLPTDISRVLYVDRPSRLTRSTQP